MHSIVSALRSLVTRVPVSRCALPEHVTPRPHRVRHRVLPKPSSRSTFMPRLPLRHTPAAFRGPVPESTFMPPLPRRHATAACRGAHSGEHGLPHLSRARPRGLRGAQFRDHVMPISSPGRPLRLPSASSRRHVQPRRPPLRARPPRRQGASSLGDSCPSSSSSRGARSRDLRASEVWPPPRHYHRPSRNVSSAWQSGDIGSC